MNLLKEILGYLLGAMLFVALVPSVMWMVSGMPPLALIGTLSAFISISLMLCGLALSIWTIVYMKLYGKGNPMDAIGHELAPHTQILLTDGPYRLNRNPMLSGTLSYLAGVVVWLWTWQAALVWLLFLAIMSVQIVSEERRLLRDFGDEYKAYCRSTRRF